MERVMIGIVFYVGLCAVSHAAPRVARRPAAAAPTLASNPSPAVRSLPYSEREVIKVRAKLRFSTLLVLPKDEKILDFVCGDRDFWVIDGVANMAHVKPAKAGARTNLNLLTASGAVYSFLLQEVSEEPHADPDVKIFVERREDPQAILAKTPLAGGPSPEEIRKQLEEANAKAKSAQQNADEHIRRYRTEYPIKLRYYKIHTSKAPFYITAMYHDDHFTFLQGKPSEVPALYELKDGKPNLVNFEYRNGTFSVGKILDSGYLVIGKKKLNFTRKD